MPPATSTSPEPRASFRINPKLPGLASGAGIEVTPATDADVYLALLGNESFPARPIALGRVAITATGAHRVETGGRGSVSFSGTAGGHLGLAVLDRGSDVADTLAVNEAEGMDLLFEDLPGVRYAVFRWGYEVEARGEGTHPLGALGSGSFGVTGRRSALHAVVRRFEATAGARDVLVGLFDAWCLPRHVSGAADLPPGTTVVAEVEGSIAIDLAAQLGYDVSLLRELRAGTVTGDVGLHVDARARATIGLEASGRYVVSVGRDSLDPDDARVRVRLLKLSTKGWKFGLDLAASVTPQGPALPESADGLLAAVFGVHGLQVMKDLRALEGWTDPARDPATLVAGLAHDAALDLLRRATGIDPEVAFERARGALTAAVRRWDELPHRFAATLWSALERAGADPQLAASLRAGLAALAGDPAARKTAIASALANVSFGDSPLGKLVAAGADRGLAALLERSDHLGRLAATALDLVDGGIVQRLQGVIASRLRLETVRRAVTESDFERLDAWLVARLSAALDERFEFSRLRDVQLAIDAVLAKRDEIDGVVREALTRTYDFELARRYHRATARTALLDVVFDTSVPAARERLADVLAHARYDRVFVEDSPGVSLRHGVLTHEISRTASVEVTFPFHQARLEHLTTSLARVRASAEGGRVLFYELEAADLVSRRNRVKSELAVGGTIPVPRHADGDGVRRFAAAELTWSYRYLHARENIRREELEYLLAPIVHEYFPAHFGAGESSFSTWLTDFDRRVEEVAGTPTNDFGDVLLWLEVTAPARALAAWLEPRDETALRQAAQAVSLRLQRVLKLLIPYNYFAPPDRLQEDARAAALLIYGALPPRTSVRLDGDRLTENTGEHVYWDWRDARLRDRMVHHPSTLARLRASVAAAEARLLAMGEAGRAPFFDATRLDRFTAHVRGGFGEFCLTRLLRVESEIVEGAARALQEAAAFRARAADGPSAAIERLAAFGEHVTTTFNGELEMFFGKEGLRPLGTAVFLEASCALDPALASTGPNALLGLTVLREDRSFDMATFLGGAIPERGEVALAERLVTAD